MPKTTSSFLQKMAAHDFTQSGTLLIDEVQLKPEEFLCRLPDLGLAPIASSEGFVSTVREAYDPVDFNKHGRNFDFHTDGLYYSAVPEFVLLYCVNPGNGLTRTTFADTRPVAAEILSDKELAFLQHAELVWVGKDAVDYSQPLVHRHPRTGEPVLHATGRGFLRPRVTVDQIARTPSLREFVKLQERLFQIIDRNIVVRHAWRPDQALIFDNCTFVHAREALGENPNRELLRIWFGRSDVSARNRKGSRTDA